MNNWRPVSQGVLFGGIAAVSALLICAVISFALSSIFNTFEMFDAVWTSHEAATIYVIENEGSWPKAWSDLRPIMNRNIDTPERIDRIQAIVDIDFQFDPKCELSQFCAFSMRDGTSNGEVALVLRRTCYFRTLNNCDNVIATPGIQMEFPCFLRV